MKNTFGNSICLTLFGESHGPSVGAVIDGIAPGIKIDLDYIKKRLGMRAAVSDLSTSRHEADEVEFLSGVFEGYTTGSPLCLVIKNSNTRSRDYKELMTSPRPSHADYTANCKYHGFQDYRGGGHFSGRVTAALVAAGAILMSALEAKGIKIGTHISSLAGIYDRGFSDIREDILALEALSFPALDTSASEAMQSKIRDARAEGDSVGGILESCIIGMPCGVGEPFFDSIESSLSHILFSIPGIKGVEFGLGFGFADKRGSECNDAFCIKDGSVATVTNNNGGINGGISNGMPILFRTAVRPTPSIFKEQATVNLKEMTDTSIVIKGRHDPAIIHRARAVVDAACAIAVADMLAVRYGTDYLAGKGNP